MFDGQNLTVTGNVTALNHILSGSDRRLKFQIRKIKKLDWADDIQFKSFRFKNFPEDVRYGVIARNIEKLAPQLVKTNSETGMKSVSYIDLLVVKLARQDEIINQLLIRLKKLENEKN